MELRPYQSEAKAAVFTQWDKGARKTLVVLPTGCGKTIVFAKVAEECVRQGNRVLILAHRGELLEQAADKIKKWCHGYVNALIVMQACNILARIAAYFIGFEGKNLWFAMAVIGLGGIPLGAAAIAQTAIFCDSIDYMEWKTGKRTEGITFSMQTSFTKISSGITAGLATLALHLLH
mgnify:CR=1 FL=1